MRTYWIKNDSAVSPVIGTILMVAVTVVLAAALYVLVMGMGSDNDPNPPQASLNADEGRLVLTISKTYAIGDDILQVTIDNGEKLDLVDGTISGTVTFVDNGDDGKIGSGDYFTNSAAETCIIKLIWTSGGVSRVIAEGEI
ncbi:MAG TPA: type IV pilin [Methanomassiliicoccales archaeon]|nr:type IV pilin [Methanomassiliicoccales archaeon]